MIKTFFGSHTKKVFMCILEKKSQIQTYFDSQSHSSYNKNKRVETSVLKFCGILPAVLEIFPGFLANQNFCGCSCTPCVPTPYTTVETGLEIKYRDSITVIHGIKYRYPTNSLAISMQHRRSHLGAQRGMPPKMLNIYSHFVL